MLTVNPGFNGAPADAGGTASTRPDAAAKSRGDARLRVAYLVNQYPKVSHSFIRREILALERQGVAVERIAVRGWDANVVDADDLAELTYTRHILKDGIGPSLRAAFRVLRSQPGRFLAALGEAVRLSRGSERALPYHLTYLAEACLVLEWVRAAGVSHVHAHFGTNSAEVAMLVHRLGGPSYSFTVHGPEEFDKAHALHLDRKIAAAKFVVAVSSYGRAQLFRHAAPSDWAKIKVVHCGLEKAFHDVAHERPASKHRLVCVGRLCEQKGQLILLAAFARLRAKIKDCHLVLAGDGEMRPEIEARIAALNLKDAVTITGWISGAEVRREILAAQALVLPSFQEGLPVVLMEAMALGRPVISTYVAGIPELVIPGENGWLVPAGDVTLLAEAMQACLEAPPEALQTMGAAAARRATSRHDIDAEAAKLAALLQSDTVADEIEAWQS